MEEVTEHFAEINNILLVDGVRGKDKNENKSAVKSKDIIRRKYMRRRLFLIAAILSWSWIWLYV